MNSILQDIENGFKWLGQEFHKIVVAMWETAKQQAMTDGTKLLSDEAATIAAASQSTLPSKDLGKQLMVIAEGDLSADLVSLTWGEILTCIGVVVSDYEQANSGNKGILPGGDQGATPA